MLKNPREILAQAAKAAVSIIPEQEALIQEKERELITLRAELQRLRDLASVAEASATPSARSLAAMGIGPFPGASTAAPMSVTSKIERVLTNADHPLSAREISEEIEKLFGEKVPTSTLYGVLAKIRTSEAVSSEDGKWSLKKVEAHG